MSIIEHLFTETGIIPDLILIVGVIVICMLIKEDS